MAALQQQVGGLPSEATTARRSFAEVLAARKCAFPTPTTQQNPKSGQSIEEVKHGHHKGEPAAFLSDTLLQALATPYTWSLVGKFSQGFNRNNPKQGRPSLENLHKFILTLDFKGDFSLGLLDNRHIIIHLCCEEDYLRLYSRMVWTVGTVTMRIFRWSPYFRVDKESSLAPIWLSFPRLPIMLFEQSTLFSIARLIGTPLRCDLATTTMKRPSVARLQVEVDLTKPLPSRLWIGIGDSDGYWQKIDYEYVPAYCDHCWHIGHNKSDCHVFNPLLKNSVEEEEQKNTTQQDTTWKPPQQKWFMKAPTLQNSCNDGTNTEQITTPILKQNQISTIVPLPDQSSQDTPAVKTDAANLNSAETHTLQVSADPNPSGDSLMELGTIPSPRPVALCANGGYETAAKESTNHNTQALQSLQEPIAADIEERQATADPNIQTGLPSSTELGARSSPQPIIQCPDEGNETPQAARKATDEEELGTFDRQILNNPEHQQGNETPQLLDATQQGSVPEASQSHAPLGEEAFLNGIGDSNLQLAPAEQKISDPPILKRGRGRPRKATTTEPMQTIPVAEHVQTIHPPTAAETPTQTNMVAAHMHIISPCTTTTIQTVPSAHIVPIESTTSIVAQDIPQALAYNSLQPLVHERHACSTPKLNAAATAWHPRDWKGPDTEFLVGQSSIPPILLQGRIHPSTSADNLNYEDEAQVGWELEYDEEDDENLSIDSMQDFLDSQETRDDAYMLQRKNSQKRRERDIVQLKRGRGRPLGVHRPTMM